MKGYFLFAPVEADNVGPGSGVELKVRAQHRALQSWLDCELLTLPVVTYRNSLWEKIVRRLPYTAAWRKWKYRGEFDGADFVYIRQVYHDQSFLRYLRAIRAHNPGIKLIYEVPTYPFEPGPAAGKKKKRRSRNPYALKRSKSWKKIAAQMDRIATFYGQERIAGVPCINMINGFDFSRVALPERQLGNTIHLISVSATAYWHGYDRLIEGLRQYYENGGKRDVVYHLVGTVLPAHRSMVEHYGLQEHVILHGPMHGEALRALYCQAAIGIDVLGGHRKNYPVSSSLKSREYCAYGLPVVTASPVDFMPADFPWQMLVPYDDSPIDLEQLVDFYQSVYGHTAPAEVAAGIRSYAEQRCDMRVAMKPVADWLLRQAISEQN